MSHLSFLGCEPARCGNWAARGLEFKRTVGVPHGVRKRRGLNAIFRPPTGFSRDARVRFRRDAGLSCRWLLARQPKVLITAHNPRRTQVTFGYEDSDGKNRQSVPFLMIVAPNMNSTLKHDLGCDATKATAWSTKFTLPVFLSADHQRFLDNCEKRLADALYVMSFPAASAVAPHINEIREESADATQFCARLFETPGVYAAYTDGVTLAERVLEGASTKVAKLDTPNTTLNLLAAMGKQFNWPPTGHVTTQGVREDHTANNTESFTAIKGLAAGRPVLLHVGVVGVISVSKTSGKLYAKVPA